MIIMKNCVTEGMKSRETTRHLQHVGTCEVQREMHQAANIDQRTANLTTI